jgi:DNA-binding LacI/PurR family transcriptional regulator
MYGQRVWISRESSRHRQYLRGALTMDTTIPKYLLVEDYIRQAIRQRKIVDKLPGERVLARELGYSYMTIRKAIDNLVAEGLLYKVPTRGTFVAERKSDKAKTRTIGYFLDSRIAGGLSSPYYAMIFNALEKQTAKAGYSLVYFTDSNESSLDKVLKKLDGVIASSFLRVEPLIQQIKAEIPVVAIDNSVADKSIPSVIIDNFNAELETVDYLCSLGHRRIGFITGLEDSDVGKNRYEGYKSGLLKNGIELDHELVFRGNYTFGSGVSGAEYYLSLKQRPTAIICANDSMALGAISKLHQEGLEVPRDISVVGFDDINIAGQVTPPLTTVSVPVDTIAERAFEMLQSQIEGKALDNRHVALEAHLVARSTSRAPREKIAAA